MATERISTANEFKGIYILYYALVAGQVLIALVISYLMMGNEISFSLKMDNPFYLIAPILMLGCISVSSFLFAKRMEEAKIVKYIVGEANPAEATEILDWVSKSEDNKALFEDLTATCS